MSDNYIVINGKRAELTKEQMEQLGIEVEEGKRWRAKEGGLYFYVTDGGIVSYANESNNYADKFMYFSHNYFEFEGEARIYARVLETEMLLKKYADEYNKEFGVSKWHFAYDDCTVDHQEIKAIKYINAETTTILPRIIYFSSYEIALFAVNEIGKNRIIEYLTYEW